MDRRKVLPMQSMTLISCDNLRSRVRLAHAEAHSLSAIPFPRSSMRKAFPCLVLCMLTACNIGQAPPTATDNGTGTTQEAGQRSDNHSTAADDNEKSSAAAAAVPAGFRRYEHTDGLFSLALPESWLAGDESGKYDKPHYPITELGSASFGDPNGAYEIMLDVYHAGNANKGTKTWRSFAQEQAVITTRDTMVRQEKLPELTMEEYESKPAAGALITIRYKVLFITEAMVVGLWFPENDATAKTIVSTFMLLNPIEVAARKAAASSAAIAEQNADPDVQTIRSFYGYIQDHKFEEAYNLYSVKKVSLSTFTGWYKQVKTVTVDDIKKTDVNTYEIVVSLTEENGTKSQYYVKMRVADGRLETLSSKNVHDTTQTCHGTVCASVYRNYETYCININIPGAKAPKMLECSSGKATFSNLRFSPRGNFVLFDEKFDTPQGVHIVNTHLYVVATQQRIDVLLDNPNSLEVVLDDTRIVGCGVPASSTNGYVRIYSLPDGKLLKWEILEGESPKCSYDTGTKTVRWSDPQGQLQSLDVNTGDRLP